MNTGRLCRTAARKKSMHPRSAKFSTSLVLRASRRSARPCGDDLTLETILSKSASWGSIRSSHENRSGYFINAIIAPGMPYLADIGDPKAVAEMVASTQQKFG